MKDERGANSIPSLKESIRDIVHSLHELGPWEWTYRSYDLTHDATGIVVDWSRRWKLRRCELYFQSRLKDGSGCVFVPLSIWESRLLWRGVKRAIRMRCRDVWDAQYEKEESLTDGSD